VKRVVATAASSSSSSDATATTTLGVSAIDLRKAYLKKQLRLVCMKLCLLVSSMKKDTTLPWSRTSGNSLSLPLKANELKAEKAFIESEKFKPSGSLKMLKMLQLYTDDRNIVQVAVAAAAKVNYFLFTYEISMS
jgi:hypothetical protein